MKIFISYRRQDSPVITGRIYDRLVSAFGGRTVFRDIDDIPAGSDFRTVLDHEAGSSNIMLVIIGPQWAGITDSNGNKRLMDPNDFVRIEVEAGLKRKDILVIPVLALGATMPLAGELPESLKDLIFRNAATVRNDPDFDHDVQRLIRQIRNATPVTQKIMQRAGIGLAITALLALFLFGLPGLLKTNPDSTPTIASQTIGTENSNQNSTPTSIEETSNISVGAGFGARGNGWQLYFTNPAENSNPTRVVDVSALSNVTIFAARGISLYQEANQDSLIISRASAGDSILITKANDDGTWLHVQLQNDAEGWMLTDDIVSVSATPIAAPSTEGSQFGINIRLVDAISRTKNTLDIAAFTLDEEEITKAIIEAHQNGVTVRVVTDNESGLGDPKNTFSQLIEAGIPVVTDESSALMHDKFIIMDSTTVWTGSWNYTQNSTFKNNENAIVFDSPQIAAMYKTEFDKMFEQKLFGNNKPANTLHEAQIPDGLMLIYFTPEDKVESDIIGLLSSAQKSIRVLAYTFTHDGYRDAILSAMQKGVVFQGIVEKTGWEYGEFPTMLCAGADARWDGNPHFLHHDVIIIDNSVVVTGSMNFSMNSITANNENELIFQNKALAQAYNAEFDRLWAVAQAPSDFICPSPTP